MAAATGISIEEYLHTEYEPDCDYVDGQVQERSVGEYDHFTRPSFLCIEILSPEDRVSRSWERSPRARTQAKPPAPPRQIQQLATEVGQAFSLPRMQRKIRDYFEFGVKYVWVIDPQERRGWIHTSMDTHGAVDGILRTSDPEITIRLSDVLPDHE